MGKSIKEARGMILLDLARAAEDRTLWPSLNHRVVRCQRGPNGYITQKKLGYYTLCFYHLLSFLGLIT